jgi:hypothetical protein
MIDPRIIAASIVGTVDWQSEVSGFCRCPGEALHTQRNGKKDCRVNVDGAPTIYCFHASCAPAVAAANKRLRRELGAGSGQQQERTNLPLVFEQKHPEDLVAFRVRCIGRNLPASAVAATAVVMTPATFVAVTVVTAIVAIVVVPLVPRFDVNHRRRAIGHRRRAVNDGWRTIRHGRRITGGRDHDLRCIPNRSGKRDAHGPTRLRRGGEPSDCNDGNQTKERFCFHARFDGGFSGVFSGQKSRDVFRCEAVREKGSKNE